MTHDDRSLAEAVARSATVAEVLIRRGALADTGAVFHRHFGTGPACLVADDNTWAAAGATTEAALRNAGIVTSRLILPGAPRPKPNVELAATLRDALAAGDATPVAIGSGVLNDLVKHAAFQLDRPYLCVATAASMDGYTSAGAPLSDRGFKKTIPCRPARVLLADLDVIAAAPPAMSGWGYGDLAGKVPAGGDWIIADALGIEPIDNLAWPMVQDALPGWLANPAGIAAGDPAALQGLFTGLILVGLAMELHGSSRPASGADHQIAHLWEMQGLTQDGEPVSHGSCVAVACCAVLALYDWLLTRDLTRLDIQAILDQAETPQAKATAIRQAFGPGEVSDRALAETLAKHPDPATHRDRLNHLRRIWPGLATRLRAQLIPAASMRAQLALALAPTTAAQIGITPDRLRRSIAHARFLRSRYTLLDLLQDTGLLAQAIAAVVPAEDFRA